MSVTTVTTVAPAKSLLTGGFTAVAVATAATSLIAAAAEFAGIGAVVGGAPIPVTGFAVLTAVFSTAGLLLALVLARTVRHPRAVFLHTTLALTALSLVPDVLVDAPASTKVLLMLAHVVAAAIVVPALTRRTPAARA